MVIKFMVIKFMVIKFMVIKFMVIKFMVIKFMVIKFMVIKSVIKIHINWFVDLRGRNHQYLKFFQYIFLTHFLLF